MRVARMGNFCSLKVTCHNARINTNFARIVKPVTT